MSDEQVTSTGKPLQVIPWSEKTPKWFEKNGEWFISKANFNFGSNGHTDQRKDLRLLYEVYNNQFPLEWFSTITDPLSAKDPKNKAFPAKIRPVSILRTNIGLLLGEYPRRPFVYNVENLGESGFNQYTDDLNNQVHDALTQHFIQTAIQQSGQEPTQEQLAELQKNPPLPEDIKTDFEMSYRDAIAVKGQKWLRKVLREYGIRKKFSKMFFDWLVAGSAFSYKGIRNKRLVYRKVSPLEISFDKSMGTELVEDGEWVVHRRLLAPSDAVDEFHSVLKEQNVRDLEGKYLWDSPETFYSYLQGLYTGGDNAGRVPVYHIQWKGKKCVKKLSYFDEETFQMVETEVDEDFDEKSIPGCKCVKEWRTEVYEVERIGKDLYVNGQALVCPRDGELGTSDKLSYNGKNYSDTHAENISVLELGLPFQIMVIIITYIIEKTIAKSKGKILLMDGNAIPAGEGKEGWDEERFFYYGEAMGYLLIDRNQIGVDKSWNQYQVLDMSLFDQIKQLIELKQSFMQEWDDLLGISRQRKAQTMASDGVGNNERAVFQSTIITDTIFSGFEEFTESELQGLMDLGKYLTAEGLNTTYQDDDFGTMIMQIAPEDFTNADLGVFVDSSAEHLRKLQKMEDMAQAMLQNNAKPSTMMEVIDTINATELKAKLKRIEAIEAEIAQNQAESQQQHEKDMEEMQHRYADYASMLKIKEINAEYDRKEDMLYIEMGMEAANTPEESTEVSPIDLAKLDIDRSRLQLERDQQLTDRSIRDKEINLKMLALSHTVNTDNRKLEQGDKKLKIDAKKAAQRPKVSKK